MHRIFASLILFCALSLCALQPAAAVTIAWTPVGNPGNANDPATGNLYGGVAYNYQIDKYDVTNSQYVEFLNAKDQTGANTLSLWSNAMFGVTFNAGNVDGSKYSVASTDGNHPVGNVTWYDAIRFANWMNNGQGDGDTETGAYNIGPLIPGSDGQPINSVNIARNPGASIFLPSENEWYKAAYYNPGTSSYFQYPTSSNTVPFGSSPSSLPNHANFAPHGPNTLTDVGAYTGTMSPYGAFDMAGNVVQWNEALIFGEFRGLRGGSYTDISDDFQSRARGAEFPYNTGNPENGPNGFRLASSIPEPSSLVLAALGFIGFAVWGRRRRKR